MGEWIYPGMDQGQRMSRLEFFLLTGMFLPVQLDAMITLPNHQLRLKGIEKMITKGEGCRITNMMIYGCVCAGVTKNLQARPAEMSHAKWRWSLTITLVNRLSFSPSDLICVDESMPMWYGLGGYWINHGLAQYIAMDCKAVDGCEIQNSCDGWMGEGDAAETEDH
eukprot:scaffold87706_cov72-Attheya_sp.AAC.1